jgi:hypothetical protein
MINKMACCAAALLLSACALGSDAGAPGVVAAADTTSAAPVASAALSVDQARAINKLLAYQAGLKQADAPSLARSLQTLTQPGAEAALQRAMLLAAQRGRGDLDRAQAQLASVLQSRAPEALHLKPLARVLAGHYAELLRQDVALDKLDAALRQSQRRNDALREQLDALKNIERTLSAPGLK